MKRLALALTLFTFAACTQRDVEHAGDTFASAAPKLANDGIVLARVEAQLVKIDADSALHVAVTSHDGLVKLTGKVKSVAIGAHYVAAARAVPGVTRVDAALVPDPHLIPARQGVSDFALAAEVRAALVGQAGVNALTLDVKAHAGAVILSGNVRTAAIRTTLLEAARATRGVRSVTDRLNVVP